MTVAAAATNRADYTNAPRMHAAVHVVSCFLPLLLTEAVLFVCYKYKNTDKDARAAQFMLNVQKAAVLGLLAIVPATVLQTLLAPLFATPFARSLFGVLVYALFVNGLIEETAKTALFFVLYTKVLHKNQAETINGGRLMPEVKPFFATTDRGANAAPETTGEHETFAEYGTTSECGTKSEQATPTAQAKPLGQPTPFGYGKPFRQTTLIERAVHGASEFAERTMQPQGTMRIPPTPLGSDYLQHRPETFGFTRAFGHALARADSGCTAFVLAFVIGVSFGCIENIVYLLTNARFYPLRLITAVVLHGACSAISSGFAVSFAAFCAEKRCTAARRFKKRHKDDRSSKEKVFDTQNTEERRFDARQTYEQHFADARPKAPLFKVHRDDESRFNALRNGERPFCEQSLPEQTAAHYAHDLHKIDDASFENPFVNKAQNAVCAPRVSVGTFALSIVLHGLYNFFAVQGGVFYCFAVLCILFALYECTVLYKKAARVGE